MKVLPTIYYNSNKTKCKKGMTYCELLALHVATEYAHMTSCCKHTFVKEFTHERTFMTHASFLPNCADMLKIPLSVLWL